MSDKKRIHDVPSAKRLEEDIRCPYLRAAYKDRLSCEAPDETGATCLILYFKSAKNFATWVREECCSQRENECPLRHLLNEQYGVDKY